MTAKLIPFTDFETTGIDPSTDVPLEAYFDLRVVEHPGAEPVQLAAFHAYIDSAYDVSRMHPIAVEMHHANGLWADLEAYRESRVSMSAIDATVAGAIEAAKADFPGASVHLGGMGVANFDKRLIERDMPLMNKLLHYRCEDMSIVEMFAKDAGWTAPVGEPAFSAVAHRAKEDVEQSIQKFVYFSRVLGRALESAA